MCPRSFLPLLSLLLALPGACDRSSGTPGAAIDLPFFLRVDLVVARASTGTLSRERIEFQTDFLRTLKGGRLDEAVDVLALGAARDRCTAGRPDPAFRTCFEDFDFPHLKLLEREMTPAARTDLLPACAPHLANCHDMVFTVDDREGHEVRVELGQVCRYRGRYWIFGKMSCSRRQSDSNR